MPTLPGCRSQDLRINIDRNFRRRRVSVGVGWWMVFQTFKDHCLVGEGKQSRRVCQAPGGWLLGTLHTVPEDHRFALSIELVHPRQNDVAPR